jgi:hypothetical protein
MKFRIVKKYYTNNTPYYIVQQKKLLWWGVPEHDALSKFTFFVTDGYFSCIKFKSVEEAEDAVKIAKLSYELKDEVIKELKKKSEVDEDPS